MENVKVYSSGSQNSYTVQTDLPVMQSKLTRKASFISSIDLIQGLCKSENKTDIWETVCLLGLSVYVCWLEQKAWAVQGYYGIRVLGY